MLRTSLVFGQLVGLGALASACEGLGSCRKDPPSGATTTTTTTNDLEVEVVGCGALRRAKERAICELPDHRTIRIVLPKGATEPRFHVATAQDPQGTKTTPSSVIDAGVSRGDVARKDEAPLLSIIVPPGATKIAIDATLAGKKDAARTSIDVADADARPWLDEARAARSKGNLDRATELATAHAEGSDGAERALAKGLLARLALSRGRADEAFPLFREAIDLHRSVGRVSDAADDSFALAFALHQRSQRYTEARAVLDAVKPDIALYAEGRARDPYYRGVLAAETGDRRRALALLREAEGHARRLGMTRLERNARSALALELQEMGRARASLPLLAALEAELDEASRATTTASGSAPGGDAPPSACERVEVANNRGWGALLVNEAAAAQGEPSTEDARSPLERALAISGCADVYVRGFALANLARLALSEADLKSAERRLAEAKANIKEPRGTERIAWMELEGRLHLARGAQTGIGNGSSRIINNAQNARDALRVFDEALALARASVLHLQEWSLLVARGEALEALGRTKDAIESFEQAEDVLDDATLLVPLGEGRGAFVGGRSGSARALLGLLVKTGRVREAALAGRRAQARVLSSVERGLRLEQLTPTDRAKWEASVHAFRAARAAIDTDAAGDWKLPADALKRAADARAERERELRSSLEGAMALLERPTTDPSQANGRKEALGSKRRTTPEFVAPGVIEIDIHLDRQGFVALVIQGQGASAHRLPSPRGTSDADLAHALLDPIRSSLSELSPTSTGGLGAELPIRESTLRIRAYGAWRSVDVHALPWQGEPVLSRIAVDYALGLGSLTPQRVSTNPNTPPSILVVGDPTSDLPRALEEARGVARALEKAGKVHLLVRDEATSRAVTDALRGADQLHYAGHGIFAGEEGWESALPLAAGGRLTIGDVLALSPTPRTVVLTGCEAAKNIGEAEGLGLAQAFLVAGSSDVLAPVRPVPDALAGKVAAALYKKPNAVSEASSRDGGGGGSPAGLIRVPLALPARAAILALREEDPSADWAAFRVLVP